MEPSLNLRFCGSHSNHSRAFTPCIVGKFPTAQVFMTTTNPLSSIPFQAFACDVRYAPHLPIFSHMTWVDPRNWFTDTFPRVSCV